MKPALFAIAGNKEMSGTEAGHVGSLRLLSLGSRVMTCASFLDIASALKEAAKDASSVTPKMVHEFIAGRGSVTFSKAFVRSHSVFHFTVGPGDALYMPPCFAYAEKTLTSDAVGLRIGILTAGHTKAIEESRLFFAAAKKNSTSLQAVVDCLAMQG